MAYLPPKRIFLLDQAALTNHHEYNTGFQKGDKASTMTSKDTWLHPRYTWSVEAVKNVLQEANPKYKGLNGDISQSKGRKN